MESAGLSSSEYQNPHKTLLDKPAVARKNRNSGFFNGLLAAR